MANRITCPNCGRIKFDLHDYESMIVIDDRHALFSLRCPTCGQTVSSVQAIPLDLREEVRFAAIEVGAGMGRSNRSEE
ncbi:MAG: UDP-N-acetylmuramoylalanyl-D-glutamate--2,6-diaminopimelate ligase [Eggerthellaceae bacterium]|jgi:4-hydroxy-3-methylbut-2-en-1-yl diphosphate synthase IspG/GcpE